MEDKRHEVVVIGGGPGGIAAAVRAAERGMDVALVERGDLGGTCLNRGCVPTKMLLSASGLYAKMRSSPVRGVVASDASYDFALIRENITGTVVRLRAGVGEMLKSKGVSVIRASARFAGADAIAVSPSDGGGSLLIFENAIVATGSASSSPISSPDSARILSPEDFLTRYAPPSSLIVLGGGATGCEMATMAAQFGARVTLVEREDSLLPFLDADVSAEVASSLEAMGVKLLLGNPLEEVEADDDGVYGVCGGGEVYGDYLLAAAGRRANVDGLGLDAAGVACEAMGISVDGFCRTSNKHVFAIGDCAAGGPLLANWAAAQGRAVADTVAGLSATFPQSVPYCVFTSPEVAACGMNERQAAEAYGAVSCRRASFASNAMALAHGVRRGFSKRICAGGRAVGVEIVGDGASELIYAAALEMGIDAPPPHPTLSEILSPII